MKRLVSVVVVALCAAMAGAEPPAREPFLDGKGRRQPAERFGDRQPFEYEPANVPFYVPNARWGTTGDAITQMQKPLPPDESRKHVITPSGFAVDVFASEPLLAAKPLAFAFDHDGRLFVSESVDYPNGLVLPGEGEGRDRIVSLVDTDGDGKADTRTVFAAKLSVCTSLLAHDGGLIVTQAPDTLYLADTDGDGRADVRRTLFTGWGTYDTHAGPSNLTWGLDGWVYGVVGYAGFKGEVGGERHEFKQGFYRFRPDGSKLEFLRSLNSNAWGFGFSEEGLLFGSTANHNPSDHMPLANGVYERVRGWSATTLGGIAGNPKMELAPRVDGPDGKAPIRQVDHHGHFTAAAGHRLYTARAYPRDYWNRAAFVCEPTGHVVATFALMPKGAAYTSRMVGNLVASDDEWTAPIAADIGPDGSVWVIDWYNFIVQHNPTPAGFTKGKGNAYETPLRDKVHGRIWRVVHDQSPRPERNTLAGADAAALVMALRDTNMFWRERAQRKLVERAGGRPDGGRDVVPALVDLVQDTSVDAIGLNPAAIHAVWTLAQLGALEGGTADIAAVAAVHAALAHPSAGVRMNAVRALPRTPATVTAFASSGVANDAAPHVRLAVLESLGELPPAAETAALVLAILADPRTDADAVLADAATSAAAVQAAGVLPALLVAGATEASKRRLAIVERVAEHVARGADGAAVNGLVPRLVEAPVAVAAAAVTGLARGWPSRTAITFDNAAREAMVKLFATLPTAGQSQLILLVQRAGSDALDAQIERVTTSLLDGIDAPGVADGERIEAARRLILLRPADLTVATQVLGRIDARSAPELAGGLLGALAQSDAEGVAEGLLDKAATLPPAVREEAYRTAVNKAAWTPLLVERLEKGTIRLTDLPLVERNRLAEYPDRNLRDRARAVIARGGGLPNADRQEVIDEILPVVSRGGDAASGKLLFREHCGKCHMHSGQGGRVGPELTGMAVHPAHELLIHILDPNRSVEGNYRASTVTTDDGRVVTGLLAAESRTTIELVDAEGTRHVIQRTEIDEFTPSTNSLMPVGFEKQIAPQGFADLLAFLTVRGKFVPLPLDKVASAVSTKGMFRNARAAEERLVFPDWGPKTFAGVPFVLVDPQDDRIANVVMLHGPRGYLPPKMPKSVSLSLGTPLKAVHILGGVAGWGFGGSGGGSTSMVVRFTYGDGKTEDHPLLNGDQIADYIRRVDVPGSEFAFDLDGRQVRYLKVSPQRPDAIVSIDLVKGDDATAPVVMALTAEMP